MKNFFKLGMLCTLFVLLMLAAFANGSKHPRASLRRQDCPRDGGHHGNEDGEPYPDHPRPAIDKFAFRVAPNGDVLIFESRRSMRLREPDAIVPKPYPVCPALQAFRITAADPVEFLLNDGAPSTGLDFSCFSQAVQRMPNLPDCPEVPEYALTLTLLDVASEAVVVDHLPMALLFNGSLREMIVQRAGPTALKLTFTQASAATCPSYLVMGTKVVQITPPEHLAASMPIVSQSEPRVTTAGVETRFYLASTDGSGNIPDASTIRSSFVTSGKPCSVLDDGSEGAAVTTGEAGFCSSMGQTFVAATFPHSGSFSMCIFDHNLQQHVPAAGVTVFGGNPAFFKVRGLRVTFLPFAVIFYGDALDATHDEVKFIDYFSACDDPNAVVVEAAKQTPLNGAGGVMDAVADGTTFLMVVFSEPVTARACYKTGGSDRYVEVPLFDNLDVTAQEYVTSIPDDGEEHHGDGSSVAASSAVQSEDSADEGSGSSSSAGWGGSYEDEDSSGAASSNGEDESDGEGETTDSDHNHDNEETRPPRPSSCPRAPTAFLDTFGHSAILVTFAQGQTSIPPAFAAAVAKILCINASFVVVTPQITAHRARKATTSESAQRVNALVSIECDSSCNSHERLATLLWVFQASRVAGGAPGTIDPAVGGSGIDTMQAAPAASIVVAPPADQSPVLVHVIIGAVVGVVVGVAATLIAIACCFARRCCCFKYRRAVTPGHFEEHSPTVATTTTTTLPAATDKMEMREVNADDFIVVGIVVEKRQLDGSTTTMVTPVVASDAHADVEEL